MNNSNYSSIIWLTQGKYTIVDNDDYERINEKKWFAKKNASGTYYAVRYIAKRQTTRMHKVVMQEYESIIDHINGNGLDNRKDNLRKCSWLNNCHNKKLFKDNISGFKGITKRPNGRYQVQITFKYKTHTIGTFATAEEAARAYDKAAIRLYGEYAKTNEMLGLLNKPVIYKD